jgi:hypothetical protein
MNAVNARARRRREEPRRAVRRGAANFSHRSIHRYRNFDG